jgi:hypothetical protein
MKFPNWFKIIWWIGLLGLTGIILYKRFDAITSGQSVSADVFVFLIFVALTLVPIFSEIEFFGIKLKKEIEDLKHTINIKFGDIKNEIRNTQTQSVTNTFQGYGPPPPDNKLPELENDIDRIVKAKLKEHGVTFDSHPSSKIDVPDDNLQMFKVRYNIETQLRRIWEQRFKNGEIDARFKHLSTMRIIQDLTKFEIIDKNFYGVLREILSICNYAIHGESVTSNQVKFVTKNAKQVIDYLSQAK